MPTKFERSHTSSPGANTAAAVTLAAPGAGEANIVWSIYYSYSASPTGGNLQITDAGSTVFELDVPTTGPGVVRFDQGRKGDPNAAVVVTLAAGGTGVLGKVNVEATVGAA